MPGSCYMYFLSHPGTSYLSKEPWFLLLDNDISSQGLEAGCAHCPPGVIASQESQMVEQAKQTCAHRLQWAGVSLSVSTGERLHRKPDRRSGCVPRQPMTTQPL